MTTSNFLEKTLSKKNLEKNDTNSIYIKNDKKSHITVTLIILLLISIAAAGMMYLKIKEDIVINKNLTRMIGKLQLDNNNMQNKLKQNEELVTRYQNMQNKLKQNEELVTRYQNNSKELAQENARLKRSNTTNKVHYQTKPREQEQVYVKHQNNTNAKTYASTQQKTRVNQQIKYFHKYQGYEKLVSNSKITVRNDNRFKSNAPIYGNYKKILLGTVDCDIKQNIYKVVDECVVSHLPYGDELYLSKSNADSIKDFNSNTHMIECDYDQQYGIMHDCKVKLKSI